MYKEFTGEMRVKADHWLIFQLTQAISNQNSACLTGSYECLIGSCSFYFLDLLPERVSVRSREAGQMIIATTPESCGFHTLNTSSQIRLTRYPLSVVLIKVPVSQGGVSPKRRSTVHGMQCDLDFRSKRTHDNIIKQGYANL